MVIPLASKPRMALVAPFTGAWIEMLATTEAEAAQEAGRTLHGCVD